MGISIRGSRFGALQGSEEVMKYLLPILIATSPILLMVIFYSFMYIFTSSSVVYSFSSLISLFLVFVIILLSAIVMDKKVNFKDLDPTNTSFSKVVDAFESNEAYKISFIVITSFFGLMFLGSRLWQARQSISGLSSVSITSLPYMFMYAIVDFFKWLNNIAVDFFRNITQDIRSSEEMRSTLLRYAGIYGFIFMIGVVLYIASTDPAALTTKAYVYMFTIIIPFVILFGFIFPFSTTQRSATSTMLLLGVVVTIMTALFYAYSSMNSATLAVTSYFLNGIMALIALVGLAIFFYIFSNYLKSVEGIAGFLIYLIFYIPCLLIDFSNYILNEFKMTARPVYMLFIVEIILILLYIYLPDLINRANNTSDVIVLLEGGAFLDSRQVIGNSYQLRMLGPWPPNSVVPSTTFQYRRSYAISMWTYLNIQPPNNKSYSEETQIFNYGNGKPKISYFNNTEVDKSKDKYIIYFTNDKTGETSYELTMPSQKWNNIVFNYYSDKVDLFINGNLERTFQLFNNIPIYLATDNIEIGSKTGLSGAICNIRYYINPLSKTQIVNNYNLLMNKNPPTFQT
jgi:hypothetical protein